MTRELGRAPNRLGETFDPLWLWVESSPGSNDFELSPLPILQSRVHIGANDRIPTAEIMVGLRPSPRDVEVPYDGSNVQRDWQVQLSPTNVREAREYFGGRRRVQIRTARQQRSSDWCMFEGFVDRIGRGWSGTARSSPRWLRLYCTHTIAAADRCFGQQIFGQWRRSRAAEIALLNGVVGQTADNLCSVTAVPAVFNPGGAGNRDPKFIDLLGGSGGSEKLAVFTDAVLTLRPDSPLRRGNAERWTVAQILRYIQWAAVQPGIIPSAVQSNEPYDIVRTPVMELFTEFAQWTEFPLVHWPSPGLNWPNGTNQGEWGPNLLHLLRGWVDTTGGGEDSPVLRDALLREPANLSIEGMSVLEAFAFVCDEAGLLCYADQHVTSSGRVVSFLRFAVRGDRCRNGDRDSPGDAGQMGSQGRLPNPGQPGQPGPALGSSGATGRCSARGVYLFVSSDRSTFSQDGKTETQLANELFEKDSAMEGEIVEDLSAVTSEVLVVGDALEYECTFVELLPGWTPSQYWDISDDDDDREEAIGEVSGEEFEKRYGEGGLSNLSYATDGRVWTLNETGEYRPNIYRREQVAGHRYRDADKWHPLALRETTNIYHLAARGDDRVSTRRRPFGPMLVMHGDNRIEGPICILSFDGGLKYFTAKDCGAEVEFDSHQARITVKGNLKAIRDPGGTILDAFPYPVAYIRGLLRVGVLANIASDDALFATSRHHGDSVTSPFVRVLDRRGHLGRRLRHRDAAETQPAANSWLAHNAAVPGAGWNTGLSGSNQDKQREAQNLAERMQRDLSVPRFSGRATIPWLWRDERGPITPGYRIGDEVLGVVTGDASTFLSLTADRDVDMAATRIVGITYDQSEDGYSTTLTIEDEAVNVDDVIGVPGVVDRSAQYRRDRGGA